jgi:hypothetical protein
MERPGIAQIKGSSSTRSETMSLRPSTERDWSSFRYGWDWSSGSGGSTGHNMRRYNRKTEPMRAWYMKEWPVLLGDIR